MRPKYRFVKAMALCLRPYNLSASGVRSRRRLGEIFGEDQPGLSFRGQVAEQAAKANKINATCVIGQRWMFLAQAANPTEQMRIATQVRKIAHVGKIGLKVGQEAIGGHSIMSIGALERL